jgi:hypothetical protein
MPAVEFLAPGFVGLVVAKFALRTAFEAAPELARVFEVDLPAGIAEGLRGSCLAPETGGGSSRRLWVRAIGEAS